MSIFSLFKQKKEVSPISGMGFSDEDRERSAEVRKMKAEHKRILEQIEIEKARAELEMTKRELKEMLTETVATDSDSSIEDKMMLQLLNMAQISQMQKQQQATTTPAPTEEPLQTMTDEEIKKVLSTIPKEYLKLAKAMPDSVLGSMIAEKMPVDDDTIKRAIILIKS